MSKSARLASLPQDMNLSELLHSILLPVRIPVIQISSPAKVFFARADKVCVLLFLCPLNTFCAVHRTANACQAAKKYLRAGQDVHFDGFCRIDTLVLTSMKSTLKRLLIKRQGRTTSPRFDDRACCRCTRIEAKDHHATPRCNLWATAVSPVNPGGLDEVKNLPPEHRAKGW